MQVFRNALLSLAAVMLGGCVASAPNDVSQAINVPIKRFEVPDGSDLLMSPAAHNFRQGAISAGDPVRRGAISERFELRDGDCGGSDCTNPRARAEIELETDTLRGKIGEDSWYGWSFYNATVPAFSKENSLRLVFGQWTVGGGNDPIFRFIQLGTGEGDFAKCDPRLCNTRNTTSGDLVVQLSDIAKARNWGAEENNGYVCRLFDLTARKGQWVDIMVNTNFSASDDGYLRIWVDQRLVCNYSGPLVSATSVLSGREIRHRRGIFSSWTKRWAQSEGDRAKPQLIVYYDEFRSGRRLSDVDITQLQASAVRPVD